MVETPQNKLSFHLMQSEKITRKEEQSSKRNKNSFKQSSIHNESVMIEIQESMNQQSFSWEHQ